MLRLIKVPLVALLAALCVAAPASAGTLGDFSVTLDRPPFATANGEVRIALFDKTSSYTLRLMNGATELARVNGIAGSSTIGVSNAALAPGHLVQLFKPAIPAGPPGVAPTETYVIPAADASAVGTTINGSAPDGALARLHVDSSCNQIDDRVFPIAASGGAFSLVSPALAPGDDIRLYVFSGTGDYTFLRSRAPGETPCFNASSASFERYPTLDPSAATPFTVGVNRLRPSIAPTARLVWRRGGAILGDTNSTNTFISFDSATPPAVGDVLEVYRPQAAPAPSATVTIPAMSAVADMAVPMMAVDAPAASYLRGFLLDEFGGGEGDGRFLAVTPAGRSIFNFAVSDGRGRPRTVTANAIGVVDWRSADGRLSYQFAAARGDLVSPSGSASISSKFKLKNLKSSFSVRLRVNEAAAAKVSISVPRTLPSKKKPKRKPSGKPLTIASASPALTPPGKTLKVKLSKRGKKAIKQLKGAGRRVRTVPVTVTVTFTDPSGNAATVTRKSKLVAR